jgi:hypothetical protein
MTTIQKNIKDLIFFYIKTNYNNYLEENKLKTIPDDKINEVISKLYTERKEHLKVFIKESLKKLLKGEYPGDLVVLNILLEIFSDDELCKNRLMTEIKLHQQQIRDGVNDYSKILK